MQSKAPPTDRVLRPALAGAAATLSGIGLARFAYVPLFPAMVASGWLSGPEGGFLGAVNLAGYLVGVLGGRPAALRLGTVRTLDIGMGLAVLAFAGCGWNGGIAWLGLWRALAGLAGGILMATAGPAVQAAVPPSRRGAAGGIVVTGVGCGIVVASLAVPLLLTVGISAAWLGLAGLVAALWAFAHVRWPNGPITVPDPRAGRFADGSLVLAYALAGAGIVPHMVYFVDFVVRGRGFAPAFGSEAWLLFGLGGITGTLAGGRAADAWGAVVSLRIWLGLQTAAVAIALLPGAAALAISAALGGFGAIGLTAVALARAREIADSAAGSVWVRATAAFALAQAATGFALTALFARTGSHEALFVAGLGFSAAAFVTGLAMSARRPG